MERAPESAARFSWNHRLGTNFERVAAVVLRPTERDAQWVPCPDQCCGGHRVVPVRHGGSGFVGVCDDDDPCCEDLRLTTEQVAVWKLDERRLGRHRGKRMTNVNSTDFLRVVDHAAGMKDRWLFLAAFCLLLLGWSKPSQSAGRIKRPLHDRRLGEMGAFTGGCVTN